MSTDSPDRPRRPLKPPPNFQSRRGQLRLFVLVAACMGVLYLVTEAAKPERWGWFFGIKPPVEEPVETPEELDTRIPDSQALPDSDPDVVRVVNPFRGTLDEHAALDANDPVSRAQADGWSAFFEQATRDEHDLVAKGLKFAAKPSPLPPEDTIAWTALLEKIDGFWAGYRENALQSLTEPVKEGEEPSLSEEERETWIGVLDQVTSAWQADRAVLAKLAQSEEISWSESERERLDLWRLRWERLGLAAIKDDTVHRPAEGDAWFRLFDVLKNTSASELKKQPAERVNFVQLHKETDEYRGKLVRFSGRIMQAKRIKATENVYGIEHQYLLWIKPDDGPKTPVVVYALEMPKDFPTLDQPNLDGGYTKLREDVTITGYLFKRWAYRAKEGTHTAPLVLAKVPEWLPSPNVTRGTELPSRQTFLLWLAGTALFGVAVALMIYWRTRDTSPALKSFQTSSAAQQELQQSLDGADAGPGTLESLRLLEERDQAGEGRST